MNSRRSHLWLVALVVAACLPESPSDAICPESKAGAPRLLVTTTDFSTGWARIFDPRDCTMGPELLSSTDAVPFRQGSQAFLVHRFGVDRVDELAVDGADLAVTQSLRVEVEGVSSTNPQAIAVAPDGLRYVATYNGGQIHAFGPGELGPTKTLDISALAVDDPDQIPELSFIAARGQTLVTLVRTLDRENGFVPVAPDRVEVLDREGLSLQSIALPGEWTRQLRFDIAQDHILYGLSTALVRIDLDAGSSVAVIDEAAFAAWELDDLSLPQSFAIHWPSGTVFIAAYDPGFSAVSIYRGSLDGGPLVPIISDLDAVERTLEVVDDTLWFGDRRIGHEGLHAYGFDGTDLSQGSFVTGLPPYSITAVHSNTP